MTDYDQLVSDYEHAMNRVENLSLYVDYVKENYPIVYEIMYNRFSGLPGFAGSNENAR